MQKRITLLDKQEEMIDWLIDWWFHILLHRQHAYSHIFVTVKNVCMLARRRWGKTTSKTKTSLENLLSILPIGVVSKNKSGHRKQHFSKVWCILLVARSEPIAIVIEKPKMAKPANLLIIVWSRKKDPRFLEFLMDMYFILNVSYSSNSTCSWSYELVKIVNWSIWIMQLENLNYTPHCSFFC